MRDEDDGEPTTCPHCGSAENCEHLLAVLDLTHGTCDGGYLHARISALETLVENAFKVALASTDRADVAFDDPDLQELWECAVENDTGPNADPEVDRTVFFRLVRGALDGAGGEERTGAVDEGTASPQRRERDLALESANNRSERLERASHGSGPGNESAVAVYFAEDPAAVFGAAMAAVANALDVGVNLVLPEVGPAPTARPPPRKSKAKPRPKAGKKKSAPKRRRSRKGERSV